MKRTAFILSLSFIALVPALRSSFEPGDGGSPGDSRVLREPLSDVKLAGGATLVGGLVGTVIGGAIGAAVGGPIGAAFGGAVAGPFSAATIGGGIGAWIGVYVGLRAGDGFSAMAMGCSFWWGCD